MPAAAATPPLVLTLAGFDPTSGAGISADLKTIAANQGYGLAAITASTVQNTTGVRSYRCTPPALLEEQLEYLLAEVHPRAVKIGMLGSKDTVDVIARMLERHPVAWVVLDPIFAATDGTPLSDTAGWAQMQKRLLPLTTVVTPNLAEAERLTGLSLSKPADLEPAAQALARMGPRNVIIKAGHWERPVDLLYDGECFVPLPGDRVRTANTHGTGCTFSAALAANLAAGHQLAEAAVLAKAYLTAALKQSFAIGPGPGPINHLFRLQEILALPSRNVDPAPMAEHTTR